ncbi:hypothetical protein [Terribacillus saccharophilus]|uniref:hypothetical protein n=1 Tax=Terribacillus saccharophilus TaxID=361277 RepID=UPI003982C1EA
MLNEKPYYEVPLNHDDPLVVLDRLERYRSVDLRRITVEELINLTADTLPCILHKGWTYPKGVKLYRVRKKDTSDQMFRTTSEVSYCPEKFVKTIGRFNNEKESILYTSTDSITPFHEVKAEIDDEFALVEFETLSNLNLTDVCLGTELPFRLTINGEINHKIIEQFLFTEFTKDVGVGTEFLYKVTVSLAKMLLNVPGSQGIRYPSTPFKQGINVAIEKDAVDEKLKVISVKNVKVKDILLDGRILCDIQSESKTINKDGTIIY